VLRPFQKSHNTAFRLLTVLLYGVESGKPFLQQLWAEGRHVRLRLRSGATAYSMRMTIPRMREHLEWLEAIGLLSDLSRPGEGIIELTVKLPIPERPECHENQVKD
jgi:hypothetical protein